MNCKEKINKTMVGASVIYSGAFSKNVKTLSIIVGVTDSGYIINAYKTPKTEPIFSDKGKFIGIKQLDTTDLRKVKKEECTLIIDIKEVKEVSKRSSKGRKINPNDFSTFQQELTKQLFKKMNLKLCKRMRSGKSDDQLLGGKL